VWIGGYHLKLAAAEKPVVHLLSLYAFESVRQFGGRCEPKKPNITSREREVLHWIASGKSAWEIGEILHISKRTVDAFRQGGPQAECGESRSGRRSGDPISSYSAVIVCSNAAAPIYRRGQFFNLRFCQGDHPVERGVGHQLRGAWQARHVCPTRKDAGLPPGRHIDNCNDVVLIDDFLERHWMLKCGNELDAQMRK
jgi:hypothetical protein